ncbi:MAG: molybdopterin-dependent oxidoreductase [Deltaproteobacteria bacterium]|nr:molybdopterin-dependent oxidoreductase [Deltaproteobacteria bacterium]
MTNSIPEIRDADFLFVTGSNTSEAHPIIAMEMKRAVGRGAKLAVADPRAIWMTEISDWHMQLNPGTDVWLLNAMAHVIVTEGLESREWIEANTEHFESVRETVLRYPPEEAEKITGVPAEMIREVARAYATTEKAGIYYTLGITEHTTGTDNVYALSNLVLMTGHLGIRSAGMNPLRGQNNVQGANDSGATPVYYPGYQRADEAEIRQKFADHWGVPQSETTGLNLNEMMKAMGDGRLRGLFLMGEDIVISEPNVGRVEKAMNELEFVVVQDIFFNESCRYADVVLPAACFAEKEGVFTNSDRRVQRVRKAVEPPGEARADWQIILEIMKRAGLKQPNYANVREIYAEMASLSPKFGGISHHRIEKEGGLQWPVETPDAPSTEYLHKGGVLRGKGLFQAVEFRPPFEVADPEYPLVLSTGRTLYHYNAATQTRRSEGLSKKQPEAFVEVSRKDARKLGLQDGQMVDVVSRRGRVRCRAMVSRQVRRGSIWMPFHFPEARTNYLTTDAGDAVTGTGEYKVCAARLEPVQDSEPKQVFPGAFALAGEA